MLKYLKELCHTAKLKPSKKFIRTVTHTCVCIYIYIYVYLRLNILSNVFDFIITHFVSRVFTRVLSSCSLNYVLCSKNKHM